MLAAHLVPGYFAVVATKSRWRPVWTPAQQLVLWGVALASTVLPDADVVYNALFRGFFNHSWLWTHSVFLYLALAILWWILRRWNQFAAMILGLMVLGGFSHLLLDVIAHGTPLFYPLTPLMIGSPSMRVTQIGVLGYLTDPVFLLEPLLITIAVIHWIVNSTLPIRVRVVGSIICINILIMFAVGFLMLLPQLQSRISG